MDLLNKTPLLDFDHPSLAELVHNRQWASFPLGDRVKGIYDFVRNEIQFGYNTDDAIPASQVLRDGYGQCNTKGILLMALWRAVGIPCRLHGFTIHKELQKGAITGLWYHLAPARIVHCWIEVEIEGRWLNIEGFILDDRYLSRLQTQFAGCAGSFCGYGVATTRLLSPPVEWTGEDTYIQKEGIEQDFGVFEDPDTFFASHRQALGPVKGWLYRNWIRRTMNRNVSRIREQR